MKKIAIGSAIVLLSGCASMNTTVKTPKTSYYKPYDMNGGYSQTTSNDGLLVTRFIGNNKLNDEQVKLYSELRAIEVCRSNGKMAAVVHGTKNLNDKEVLFNTVLFNPIAPVYPSTVPSIVADANPNNMSAVAMNNQPADGSLGALSALMGTMKQSRQPANQVKNSAGVNSQSVASTYAPPMATTYDTFFKCQDSLYETWLTLRELPSDLIKDYVKDILGAVQVMDIQRSTVNDHNLYVGDIVLRIDGRRVLNTADFYRHIELAPEKKSMQFEVIRDGVRKTVGTVAVNQIEDIKRQNRLILSKACKVEEISGLSVCSDLRAPASSLK